MKLLYIVSLSGKRLDSFKLSSIIAAQKAELEYHLACNMGSADSKLWKEDAEKYGITLHHIPFCRNVLSIRNINAYILLFELMVKVKFDLVHCNTPIAGAIGRLCARQVKIPHIIYQAHGFHFWRGAPIKNWMIYYPVEKLLSKITDILITINNEDFSFALKNMNATQILFLPGVGVDISAISTTVISKDVKRQELNIPEDSLVLLSVGRIDKNKNQKVIIQALAKLNDKRLLYIIAGTGDIKTTNRLKDLACKLGVMENVLFLGFRTDISELLRAADIFCLPSFREGLSASLMEAMVFGLPCVVSNIRGNTDLILDTGGYLCDPNKPLEFASAIEKLKNNPEKRFNAGNYNREIIKKYSINIVIEKLSKIYLNVSKGEIND